MQVYETRFKKDFTPICQSWVNEIAAQLLNEVATKALWSLWVVIFKQAKKIPSSVTLWKFIRAVCRVSFQEVKSLGCHFASLCWGFDFYEVKRKKNINICQNEILSHY